MTYDYGQWWLVALNIFLFGYFIKEAFKPQNKIDWRSFQMIMAFIVALFAEMYGFPLTVFLLTSYFGSRFDFSHNKGHLLNTLLGQNGDPHFGFLHIISYLLIIGGIILISKAWKVLYEAAKENVLATTGPYAYLRHPQYLGFILIILGFLLQWPTIITLLMAPILIGRYLWLAGKEETEMDAKYHQEYQKYRVETPGFYPSWRKVFERVKLK
ncbi:isoprenylcysteine carboxylmethyltransferase family protein [Candidatus Gottesmanbacteria bacterium]|nr:isoprenylcysteine carboxylmethyltransferase family protein [Candidatus Gottesmanbacteria bacterium]